MIKEAILNVSRIAPIQAQFGVALFSPARPLRERSGNASHGGPGPVAYPFGPEESADVFVFPPNSSRSAMVAGKLSLLLFFPSTSSRD